MVRTTANSTLLVRLVASNRRLFSTTLHCWSPSLRRPARNIEPANHCRFDDSESVNENRLSGCHLRGELLASRGRLYLTLNLESTLGMTPKCAASRIQRFCGDFFPVEIHDGHGLFESRKTIERTKYIVFLTDCSCIPRAT